MTEPKMVRRAAAELETRAVGDREVRVVISTRNKDRHGDIVEPRGIDIRAFRGNPVVLFNHNWNEPVARATNIEVEDERVVATVQFPDAGVSIRADEVYGLIEAGVVNAASIGFMPREWHFEDQGGEDVWVVDRCELYEFSFVAIPSNRESLILERAFRHDDGSITLSLDDQAALFAANLARIRAQRGERPEQGREEAERAVDTLTIKLDTSALDEWAKRSAERLDAVEGIADIDERGPESVAPAESSGPPPQVLARLKVAKARAAR